MPCLMRVRCGGFVALNMIPTTVRVLGSTGEVCQFWMWSLQVGQVAAFLSFMACGV